MEFISTQKYILASPKKLRDVVYRIKGLGINAVLANLPFIESGNSKPLLKVIKTALANAKQKSIEPENLLIKEIQINEGPRLKRGRAGARGRLKPYKRRMSHIRVVLATKSTAKSLQTKAKDEKFVVSSQNALSATKGAKKYGTKN